MSLVLWGKRAAGVAGMDEQGRGRAGRRWWDPSGQQQQPEDAERRELALSRKGVCWGCSPGRGELRPAALSIPLLGGGRRELPHN